MFSLQNNRIVRNRPWHPDRFQYGSEKSSPTPPPPAPPAAAKSTDTRRRRKFLVGGISASVLLVLGVGGAAIWVTANEERLAEYDEAHENLESDYTDSADLLENAGSLEPDTREDIEEQRAQVDGLLSSKEPGILSFNIDGRTSELLDATAALAEPTSALEEALGNRKTYESSASDAQELLAEAEGLLESTEDKVADEDAYHELSDYATTLEDVLNAEPDEANGQAFADNRDAIDAAAENVNDSIATVSASHDDWTTAEEEAAQTDPANYDTPSERDWQLVERDPHAYEGEKYALHGAVTQADASTGEMTIRVNTGPTQQSRQYDYDVNTMVLAGTPDVFAEVVQGDHVKMLVEVVGAMTYDTTIGGSATAVMTMGYDVEVIGQF